MTGLRPRTGYPMAHPDIPASTWQRLRALAWIALQGVVVLAVVIALIWLFAENLPSPYGVPA